MGVPKLKYEHFTYSDYLTWNDEKRWEIIQGAAFEMTSAPNGASKNIDVSFHSYW